MFFLNLTTFLSLKLWIFTYNLLINYVEIQNLKERVTELEKEKCEEVAGLSVKMQSLALTKGGKSEDQQYLIVNISCIDKIFIITSRVHKRGGKECIPLCKRCFQV